MSWSPFTVRVQSWLNLTRNICIFQFTISIFKAYCNISPFSGLNQIFFFDNSVDFAQFFHHQQEKPQWTTCPILLPLLMLLSAKNIITFPLSYLRLQVLHDVSIDNLVLLERTFRFKYSIKCPIKVFLVH